MITLTPSRCKSALQLLEEEAETYRFRYQAFKGHNMHIAAKAKKKLQATEDLIFLVRKELHTTTVSYYDLARHRSKH